MHKWPVLVECPQFHFWHYIPQFCQDIGVEMLRDLYKIQRITGTTLISSCNGFHQFVKMPKTLLRSFPDSSSHRATSHLSHLPQFLVSEPALTLFISDRSRLSFSQSNARCPTCGNRRGKMLHLLFSAAFQSVKNISIAFAVKLSFHWKVVKYSKSSNMNIVQYIQSFAHSCRRDFEGLSLVHQEPNKS